MKELFEVHFACFVLTRVVELDRSIEFRSLTQMYFRGDTLSAESAPWQTDTGKPNSDYQGSQTACILKFARWGRDPSAQVT
jgi:hypothetical protein